MQDSMSNMKTIILASASPRRKEILQKTGLKFKVCASDYEEDMDSHSDPHKLARHLSYMKANKAAHKYKNALIIAADTFIVFKGKSLGKPHTGPEARAMLKALNGRAHSVITGFTVMDTGTNRAGEPLDKAGGYAIQGLGAVLVKKIEGDYLNVVGLPLNALIECLKEFGVDVL